MSEVRVSFLRLACAVQSYAWGKVGRESTVAQLKESSEAGFVVDPQLPYAELWMGTHKKGPAVISGPDQQLLSDWLTKNHWAMGGDSSSSVGQLPFLLKILSINKALSIQAHPTKSRAAQLHARSPEHYPDSNHKPELAIALTPFMGFCGFRPFNEIRSFVAVVPELRRVVGKELCDKVAACEEGDQKTVLKALFTGLLSSHSDIIKQELANLIGRLDACNDIPEKEKQLLKLLSQQFPGDIGCFCAFLLNIVELSPGESIFLAPNEPHAYIHGDIVECMACSDNVVRAGLTPKFRDKDTLCDMLTYEMRSPAESKFSPRPHPSLPGAMVYDPPTPEFTVVRIALPAEQQELPTLTVSSLLLVVSGSVEAQDGGSSELLVKGTCIFIPANTSMRLQAKCGETLIFQAHC